MVDKEEITSHFKNILEKDHDVSPAIGAIRTLIFFLNEKDDSKTLAELDTNLKNVIEVLKTVDTSIASVKSGCELFMRFVTPLSLDDPDFNNCKRGILQRSSNFIERLKPSRSKIANMSYPFIHDGCKVLTNSLSGVVYETFKVAAKANIRFHVYVTDSALDYKGKKLQAKLEDNIPCTLILNNAVGYIMENVDLVMVGAEAVMENGGIINQVGTVTMAICAAALHKPFYVLAESFKFLREYPLNQEDVPKNFKFMPSVLNSLTSEELKEQHPHTDFTPANYISLLFTDLGILEPSAVCDELIKLYYSLPAPEQQPTTRRTTWKCNPPPTLPSVSKAKTENGSRCSAYLKLLPQMHTSLKAILMEVQSLRSEIRQSQICQSRSVPLMSQPSISQSSAPFILRAPPTESPRQPTSSVITMSTILRGGNV